VIDSHCHLADPAFAGDLDQVVRRAHDAGVSDGLCILAFGDAAESAQAARVRAAWPGVKFAIGVHPHQAHEFAGREGEVTAAVRSALSNELGVRAIGEIGLDYHYDLSPRDVQREVFRAQVRLARETGLPVVVHTREADEDTVSILRDEGAGEVRGIFHCFSGTEQLAREALDLGFLLSFSGMVTFPKAQSIRTIAAEVPADRLLAETDCPYLAPVPMRGRRNEPAWVARTAATLAEVRRVAVNELDRVMTSNFARLLGA
jgi:TatD DNase family protein